MPDERTRRQVLAAAGAVIVGAPLGVGLIAVGKPEDPGDKEDGVPGRAHRTRTLTPPSDHPTLLFQETFASGTFANWTTCQWNAGGSIRNDNCQTYNGTSDYSATVADGGTGHEQAARFELRDGDIPFSGTERTEFGNPEGFTMPSAGDEIWQEWDMKFDSSWPVPHASSSWVIVTQWKGARAGASPPLCLDIDTDDVIYLANNDAFGLQRTAVAAVTRNVWQHWMIHAVFSTSSAVGFGEVSIDGSVVLAEHARITMLEDETEMDQFRNGIYRDPVNTATAIVWQDNIEVWGP